MGRQGWNHFTWKDCCSSYMILHLRINDTAEHFKATGRQMSCYRCYCSTVTEISINLKIGVLSDTMTVSPFTVCLCVCAYSLFWILCLNCVNYSFISSWWSSDFSHNENASLDSYEKLVFWYHVTFITCSDLFKSFLIFKNYSYL